MNGGCTQKVEIKGVLSDLTKYTYQKTCLQCLKAIENTSEAFISGMVKYLQFLIHAYHIWFGS